MSDPSVAPRAGFWRRFLAFLLDFLIVFIPLQIVVSILFVMTSGYVQLADGLTVKICGPVHAIPVLTPPPPIQSNEAHLCDIYFLWAKTARVLTVARINKEGNSTTSVSRSYMIDAAGHPINGISVDWIALAILTVYVIAMESTRGFTLGGRALGFYVANGADPNRFKAPFSRVAVRNLAFFLGFAPILLAVAFFLITSGEDPDKIAGNSLFFWLKVTGGLAFLWYAVLLFQIVSKRDPLFDRIAGTEVLRGAPPVVPDGIKTVFE